MENEILELTNQELEELTPEELVDLKFELEDMLKRIEEIIKNCD